MMTRPSNADELMRQAERLMHAPAYRDAASPDHRKVHRTVERLFEAVYGRGKPLHDPTIAATSPGQETTNR